MRILVNDRLSGKAVDRLAEAHAVDTRVRSPEELLQDIGGFDALVIRSGTRVTREVLEAGTRLQVVARAGVGVDNVDLEAARERGVTVTNAPGASANAVAELTLGHMLSLARNLQAADASLRANRWEKKALQGVELAGRTLALVGVGRIGSHVATLARALGMRVVAYDPYANAEKLRHLGVSLVDDLHEALSQGDFVSVHTPLTDETRRLLGRDAFEAMPDHGYLVCCARGGVVDEEALLDALQSGNIAGAALDVFEVEPPTDNPLLKLPNFRATPHLGASTQEAQDRVGLTVAEDVLRILAGEEPENRVV